MMQRFQQYVKSQDQPLFIPFIMAGDPTPEATIELALTLQESGAHGLELGIPYSDPLADGPVIQRAAKRALAHKMSLKRALELVPIMRERGLGIPVIVFTYYNPVLQFGEREFMNKAKECGVDGLLVPDIPFEESEELAQLCEENELQFISLVAPTSKQRIEKIAKSAKGFIYCVSSLGVTGVRNEFHPKVYEFLEDVRSYSKVPVVVGFGISNNEQVQQLQSHCDGVIVGSAIIREVEKVKELLEDEKLRKDGLFHIKRFVLSLISS
ncbi:tryptophan synthase subunit alpha [Alkalihalobacillus sp. MEB203]|uniref:Tryptophan synthase alpha chain n=2 Tax=Alkalihalobacterium chitinilyticum TaxID=2980103 RepID=A0ABT5V9Y0_9BACI|nr:tryptophan synthase subunit alpha [Alkalihalobacterium chitinilyticum]MDE5411916.1 tryptophan synthase subunit alpha [Alkalihalobacterium chitinilyticum]